MKFLRFLFNVCWVIFGGLINAIIYFCLGVVSCILIVPLIFGIPLIYFRMIPLVFAPAGKKVVLNFGAAPLRNIIYLIFFGFANVCANFALAVIFCATIIGIPLGIQQFKFAVYSIAPFGAKVE